MTLKNSDLNIFFTRGGTVPRLVNVITGIVVQEKKAVMLIVPAMHVMDMYCILGETIFQNLIF